MTVLPRDENGEPIQVNAFTDGAGAVAKVTPTSGLPVTHVQAAPTIYTISFDAAGTVSTAATYVFLNGLVPVRLVVPSGWTSADITIQCSADGATSWRDYYDSTGNVIVLKAGAGNRSIALNPQDFLGLMHIRLRSGLPGSTVAQVNAVSLTLYAAPIGA
ncbi:hypothetical protein [Deinococcus cellulosilyticus]|uniref:Uncharacterized protein n=1 Tax=Deinococcus cellulosilyticus (strain DSM 18568 / NBRC 106333 / KACC 11606 / 5516J-15) TaxID=1223518 RepID=A0A511N2W6_DEIC1|nr:hypothetical protein [Deinococcus cellulosilyticus]GEM47205.1 hypothetical protein DC3_28400 [Deinococcus cellulosilyticus NBRC 106333 = KACC 11606]